MRVIDRTCTKLLATTLLVAALAASAQPGGGTGGSTWPGGSRGSTGMGGMGRGTTGPPPMSTSPARDDLASTVRLRLDLLQEDLRLASAQRTAWATFADRVSKMVADVSRSRETTRPGTAPAPQQLEMVADTARNRLAAIEDIVDAGKALYAVLTPEQQALADARLATIVRPLADTTQTTSGRAGPLPPGPESGASEKGRRGP